MGGQEEGGNGNGEENSEEVQDSDSGGGGGEDVKEEKEEEESAEGKEEAEEAGDGEEKEEEEEEPQPKVTVDDVKTAPMDYRFPTTNQAKHCYTRYNEFHKCAADKGEDAEACVKYARYYRSLCPGDWVDKWNEERESGTFAGRY